MRKEYDFSKGKRGPVISSPGKTRITLMLDVDVIEHFRARAEAQGTGYQTLINAALRASIGPSESQAVDDRPVTSNGRPIANVSAVTEETLEETSAAIRRSRAVAAVTEMQRLSVERGKDAITPAQIEAEIASARREPFAKS